MIDPQTVVHTVQIYTPGFRWHGQLSVALRQRLSDLFNNARDDDLVEFEQMTLSHWDQAPGQSLLTMDRVAISRGNTIAILCTDCSASPRESSPDRVVKVTQRVRLFVPPFILTGDFHITREADWFNALNLTRQRFLSLTAVNISFLASDLALNDQVDFALINRQRIVAVDLSR